MTKRNLTPPDAVLVAIDMSKHRQEVLIERPEGGRRRRMTVMATKTDYDRLASDLADIGMVWRTFSPDRLGIDADRGPSLQHQRHRAGSPASAQPSTDDGQKPG